MSVGNFFGRVVNKFCRTVLHTYGSSLRHANDIIMFVSCEQCLNGPLLRPLYTRNQQATRTLCRPSLGRLLVGSLSESVVRWRVTLDHELPPPTRSPLLHHDVLRRASARCVASHREPRDGVVGRLAAVAAAGLAVLLESFELGFIKIVQKIKFALTSPYQNYT